MKGRSRRKTQTRTVTLYLYGTERFDFEGLLGAIEETLNEWSRDGRELEWDVEHEA